MGWGGKPESGARSLISTQRHSNLSHLTPLTFGFSICKNYSSLTMKLFKDSEGIKAIKTTLCIAKPWELHGSTWKQNHGTWEDGSAGKMLTLQKWGPEFESPHSHEKPALTCMLITSALGDRDRQTQRAQGLARLVKNNSEFPVQKEILSRSNKTESDRKTPNIPLQPLWAHVWVSMCAHVYVPSLQHTLKNNLIKIKYSAYLVSLMRPYVQSRHRGSYL